MKHYIRHNKDMIDSCLILLIIGALTGIICTSEMNMDILESYSSALVSTLVVPDDMTQFFIQQCLTNLLLCLLVFFLGFSILGIPLIQGAVFLKGFQIGFSAALFLITYDIKGILGIVMTLVPQILFDTMAIGVISIASIQLSGHLIACIIEPAPKVRLMSLINRKLTDFVISAVLVVISSFVKSTLGWMLIELFAQI